MNGKLNYSKIFLSFILLILSFYINYYYANKGVYPIDSFSFFDSAFYVTEGQHPIKDFWVISGILLDYVQAIFFFIFGINWNAYIFHASFFNSIITLFFFFFLNQFNKNLFFNFCLSARVPIIVLPNNWYTISISTFTYIKFDLIIFILFGCRERKKHLLDNFACFYVAIILSITSSRLNKFNINDFSYYILYFL